MKRIENENDAEFFKYLKMKKWNMLENFNCLKEQRAEREIPESNNHKKAREF